MSNVARVASTAANTLTKPLNVEDVFSTYLYTGTGAAQTINNGIDLAGEGGAVIFKSRTTTEDWHTYDTERGTSNRIALNQTTAQYSGSATYGLTAFNSNGFSVGTTGAVNGNGIDLASWTFRKAPKFFDVVTYTGDGVSGRTISHNLGCEVGMLVVKRTDSANDWQVYHRSTGATGYLRLNSTQAFGTDSADWVNTAPTTTEFTVGSAGRVNASGGSYVAYLFAHNDGDGDFGPDGDADIIKCGSFTEVSGSDVTVDLGFEPQWIMIKVTSTTGGWGMYDVMRGWTSGTDDFALTANTSNAESNVGDRWLIHPNGFTWKNTGNSRDIIYIAIRRGPMAVPTDATDVFDIHLESSSAGTYTNTTGWPVDLQLQTGRTTVVHRPYDRLRGGARYLETASTNAEQTGGTAQFDNSTGYTNSTSLDLVDWLWRRAPNFFDAVAYTGNGTAGHTVSHNLGVVPEMMWVKRRDGGSSWITYWEPLGATKGVFIDTNAAFTSTTYWNDTAPTDSVFTLGNGSTNTSSATFIAYLFASLDGVSKVGSITGNGSTSGDSQTIDCGFTSGARFVLIKRTSGPGGWYVWDSERGIVAGNDPFLTLSNTNAENTSVDLIDPTSSGFIFNYDNGWMTNISGNTYIFYAIA
jgi:hypothetical protein